METRQVFTAYDREFTSAGDDVARVMTSMNWDGSPSKASELPAFAFAADRHMVERYFATRLTDASIDLGDAGGGELARLLSNYILAAQTRMSEVGQMATSPHSSRRSASALEADIAHL